VQFKIGDRVVIVCEPFDKEWLDNGHRGVVTHNSEIAYNVVVDHKPIGRESVVPEEIYDSELFQLLREE
jgi:hypothetical protein